MKYSGAEIIIKLLEQHDINIVTGIPGGANLPLYHALSKSRIRHVLARHEQGAGFIAQGMARSTGKPAVCLATSGPGATNLLTAIADAKLDSIPIIAITGQTTSSLIGTDAFQEVDTYGLTIPVTKHNFLVRRAEELLTVIPESLRIATSGRPGPIAIDVPKDVQLETVDIREWPNPTTRDFASSIDMKMVEEAAELINNGTQKPMLFIGGGVTATESGKFVLDLAERIHAPIGSTLMGLGAVSSETPHFLGMVGMHGSRYTNEMFRESDLIIALGVRFDDRATGKINHFCPKARVIHVDIDRAEIGKIKNAEIGIEADVRDFLPNIMPYIEQRQPTHWITRAIEKAQWNKNGSNEIGPKTIIENIGKCLSSDAIIATDVGQHQMWVAQYYPFKKPRTLLTSGGLGTMGFGLPTAIGAALANPDKDIICISGDGSLLMNIQELATLKEENLNVKVIVFNNGHLGLVRQQQELFYEKTYVASKFGFNPDFPRVAEGFGLKAYSIEAEKHMLETLGNILSQTGPCLVDIPISQSENVLPMVVPGRGNHQMIGAEQHE
jgi:acetolactate synthase-1/2/3 large subunit